MREHPLIIKSTIAILYYIFTICYFGKILICGQSAGNKNINLGASETLREDLKNISYDDPTFLNGFISFTDTYPYKIVLIKHIVM